MNRPSKRASAVAGVALLLGELAIAAHLITHGYRIVSHWAFLPAVLTVLAFAALMFTWRVGVEHVLLRRAGLGAFALVGTGLACYTWFASVGDSRLSAVASYPSPDGSMELIVYEGRHMIDPFWELRVRIGEGILSYEEDIGCVNGDFASLDEVRWTSPRTVRARLSDGRVFTVQVDVKGRPDQEVDGGC